MTSSNSFESGRDGTGAAPRSDHSGAAHDRFMRLSAVALAPLGVAAAWEMASLIGKPFDAARAQLAHPLPALALIAFIAVAAPHARLGAESIIVDYVHDESLKELSLRANKWASFALPLAGILAILLIAAPR